MNIISVKWIKPIAYALMMLALAVTATSCSENVLDEQSALKKVETKFSSVNVKGAKGIVYLTDNPESRGFRGPGYYIVYENGDYEPFRVCDQKGNAIKVDFNINKVGTTIFVRPRDYEQFCAALGRANGKTEEEAEMLGDIFSRGFVLNSKTGKLELWPLPYAPDDSWPEDESGNRYLVDSDDAQNLLIRKINCDKRSLETVPVMNLRDSGLRLTDYNFQVLKGYILLNIEDYADRRNKTLVVKPDGQTQKLQIANVVNDKIYTISADEATTFTPMFSVCRIENNMLIEEPVAALDGYYENFRKMAYNPVRKTVIVGNYEYDGNKLTYLESLSGCSEYLSQAMVISGVNAWFIGGRNYIGRVDMSDYSMRRSFSPKIWVLLNTSITFSEYAVNTSKSGAMMVLRKKKLITT